MDETISGQELTGKDITVYKAGGYATLRAYLASYPENVQEEMLTRASRYSNIDLSKKYACSRYWRDTESVAGTKLVLCLQDSKAGYADYVLGFNYYNEYVEMELGVFHSNADECDYSKEELYELLRR